MFLLPPAHTYTSVYIETKGMGLVWPAYLNASATKLRSSIPVHITHNSDKPPLGSQEDAVGGGTGVGAVGYILFGGFKVNISAHTGQYLR